MLLEGPAWVERFYACLPEAKQPRWRAVGSDIYRTIGGYVTRQPRDQPDRRRHLDDRAPRSSACRTPSRSGSLVAILDLIPLAGATIAAIIVTRSRFLDSTTAGIVLLIFFVLYQQLENHVLQPLVYGRTVQLSPLVVLIAVLIGAELAGVIGALARDSGRRHDPGLVVDWLEHRRARGARSDADDGLAAPHVYRFDVGNILNLGDAGFELSRRWRACGTSALRSAWPSARLRVLGVGAMRRDRRRQARARASQPRISSKAAFSSQLNAIRRAHGLVPVRLSQPLSAAADAHSRSMGTYGYFEHESRDGSAFWKRVQRYYGAALGTWSVGENLLWSSGGVDASAALELWMESPAHRANILTPRWREVGISAVTVAGAPGVYAAATSSSSRPTSASAT